MSTLSPKGEALVRAGQRAYQPTDADRERLLGALRSQLGDSALPLDIGQAATVAASGHTIWWLISAVVLGMGIAGGVVFFARRPESQPSTPQAASVAPAAVTTKTIEPAAAPPVEQPKSAEAPALPVPAGSAPRDRLAAEVAILSRATRELRAGRPADALKALDEYRRKFPKGLLGEEQRAATAQALCALGRFDEAKAKLVELPPQSPLAVRAKQFCNASWAGR